MGLDQYVYSVAKSDKNTDRSIDPDLKPNEIYYFRKHPNLEGWMAKLWVKKGGKGTFDCEYVRLTEADLDALHVAVKNGLEDTTGFFFGVSYPEQDEYTINMIDAARFELAQGREVYYSSWW